MSQTKTARLNFRVAPSDQELFLHAAELMDESLSELLIESGHERAQQLLADRRDFALDDASWKAFMAALERSRANPAVVELLGRARPE